MSGADQFFVCLCFVCAWLAGSLLPLVWDFGQLNPDVECLYIQQIVSRYVITQERFGVGDESLVEAVTRVLSVAQGYMRQQRDECSFVSLRDVERAMMVMVWFFNLNERVLGGLLEEEEEKQYSTELPSLGGRGQNNDLNRPVVRAGIFLFFFCFFFWFFFYQNHK